eukprot:4330876-Amphidinium_carterae.1
MFTESRLVGKQSPPIVAQVDEIETTKELALENNEANVQAQPWWQYEDDVTKYNVKDIELKMNNLLQGDQSDDQ